jgi:hypothetical protein
MMLKFGRGVVVLTAALTLVAASIPSFAEAQGYGPAGGWGGGPWGGGGYYGAGYNGTGYYGAGCGCAPPPPPPCCLPPPRPCCVYGGGYYPDPVWAEPGGWGGPGRGGYGRGGYGGW